MYTSVANDTLRHAVLSTAAAAAAAERRLVRYIDTTQRSVTDNTNTVYN